MLGLISYRTTCVVVWQKKINPLSLTAVIICLATVNYQKIIHHPKLWRPTQVNEVFNSFEKSCVINNDSHIHYSIFYVTLTIRRSLPIPTDGKEYFWRDSRVVWGRINNHTQCFYTFVATRVQKIHFRKNLQQLLYFPIGENPVDGGVVNSWPLPVDHLNSPDCNHSPLIFWSKWNWQYCLHLAASPERTCTEEQIAPHTVSERAVLESQRWSQRSVSTG